MNAVSHSAPEKRHHGSVTFRTSLLRNLIVLILALALAILTVSFTGARKAVRTLCRDLVNSGTDRVETDLRRFFAPVPPVLHIFRDWSESGILDDTDPDRLNELFAPVLESLPQLIGLSIGYSDGSGYLLSRGPDEYRDVVFRNQIVTPETTGKTSQWTTWETVDGPREVQILEDMYDPRTRPWYRIVVDDEDEDPLKPVVHWTEPYPFFTTGAPGITASIRLKDNAGRTAVISLDLLLEDVSRLSENLKISANGFMIVTTSDVKTIGLPRHPEFADPERRLASFLKKPEELGIPLFSDASEQLTKQFGLEKDEVLSVERGLSEENKPFRWNFDGKGWWTYVRPCIIDEGPQFWIAVAVPEDDFLAELKEGRIYFAGFFLSALVVAGFTSVRLARRYSNPIQALIQQADRLRTLNTEESENECTDIREIAQLREAQERMRLALDSFAKYVPSDVVRELLEKGEAAVIGGRHTSMSILFTDIEGFTSLSEKMAPDQLTAHMANYFDAMIRIITEHNGTVDKLIGDAIVAFWGAPKANENHAHDAIQGALRCHEELQKLNERWEAEGLPRLPTRFGVSTGEVMVGNVGAVNRLSYTALGDAVNLASRLEGANKFYGTRIIAAANSVKEAGDQFVWRKLDKVRVLGRSEPELIYELLGERGEVSEQRLEHARLYEAAFDAYLARDFVGANNRLSALLLQDLGDSSAQRLSRLCEDAARNPPPNTWNGVSDFVEK